VVGGANAGAGGERIFQRWGQCVPNELHSSFIQESTNVASSATSSSFNANAPMNLKWDGLKALLPFGNLFHFVRCKHNQRATKTAVPQECDKVVVHFGRTSGTEKRR
jgi:hypothetical protein